ncbi:pitrilysin family protein [Stigmatella sp. ncwal1]|uniref:Pitrilysin family protein n=1 Tax=Stigmatella ashevillensis TaxID=2995309 RepID=A0ABT5D766_9BACT|nr:pitrilysin family protein [Stigmatella ashevillena]MDC0709495.1 pitrilysin family protein [Stigmatella ashevillena]
MNTFHRSVLFLAVGAWLGGCATASHAPPPPSAQVSPPTPPPAPTLQAEASVPAEPLRKPAPLETVLQSNPQSPIVSFRLVFHSGSVDDPPGREGLTALVANLLSQGGTRELSSAQLLEVLFPMAAELAVFPDKEFTTFSGRVHKDFLPRFLKIFTDVLLEPRYEPSEFERLRTDALNTVRNTLRNEDDEELGKVGLDALLFRGHPYAHFVGGTVQGLQAITLDELKVHARRVFTQDRLVIGLAGPVDEALKQTLTSRLSALPATGAPAVTLPSVTTHPGSALVLQKSTLSTAVSMGFATSLRRGDPDFFPVALALSYLGEHRQTHGWLFQELREKRGLNYGNYAYAEHFIEQPGTTFTRPNLARTQQDISLWLRPVVPTTAVFATHGALYYLDRLIQQGISRDAFEQTRGFLMSYTRLWEQTDQRRLGYAIDSLFYGTPDFLDSYRKALEQMTPESVQAAVRRRLHPSALSFVFVTQDAPALVAGLTAQAPPPLSYASAKLPAVLEEDQAILRQPLPLRPEAIEVLSASTFMEK